MGYHVRITRERLGIPAPIALEEWLRFIETSGQLVPLPTGPDAQQHAFDRHHHAVRVRHIADSWLGWSDGEIWTKNPDDELLRYMIEAASSLGARVRGDEGEFYIEAGRYSYEKDGREITRQQWHERQARRAVFYRWKGRVIVFAVGAAIGLAMVVFQRLAR